MSRINYRARFSWAAAILAALSPAACSLVVDPEAQLDGLPCDEQNQCRSGYGCVDGKCVKGEAQSPEGVGGQGAGGEGGGGPSACLGGCSDGLVCDETTGDCVVKEACSAQKCAAGQVCKGVCLTPAPGALGASCSQDPDCEGRTCLRSSTGAGVCSSACAADDACPLGFKCLFPETKDGPAAAGYCVSEVFPSCDAAIDCHPLVPRGEEGTITCALWDLRAGLVAACAPAAAGGGLSAACDVHADCGSGACLGGFCSEVCDGPDFGCDGRLRCQRTTVRVNDSVGRIPLCGPSTQPSPAKKPDATCCDVPEQCAGGFCNGASGGYFFCSGQDACAADECETGFQCVKSICEPTAGQCFPPALNVGACCLRDTDCGGGTRCLNSPEDPEAFFCGFDTPCAGHADCTDPISNLCIGEGPTARCGPAVCKP